MKTMRKSLCFAVAILLMASCSEESYVGNKNLVNQETDKGAIAFGAGSSAITRSASYGADAAALLNNRFVVGGFKKTGETYSQAFDNYAVKWFVNTAGKTASNTSDWEYVGVTPLSPVSGVSSQTVKYWDFSTTSYDFIAYSTGTSTEVNGTPSAGEVQVVAINHDNKGTAAFTLKGASNDLAGCYIADMVTVDKINYGKEVQLTFHSLASKVRMAIYETVPGYSVQNVHFYTDDQTAIANNTTISNTDATLFGANAFHSGGLYTITFPTTGSANKENADYNKAHVAISGQDVSSTQSFGTLNYTTGKLGTSSASPTFAGTSSPYYVSVLPNGNGSVLEMRVNYELLSDDGSGEVITVHGAKALIPAAYTKWLPNYAYTYLFKISDNTNGWTSTVTDDPAGLYPITFDAVVLDEVVSTNEQTTITTVAMPCITTYQKGHVYTDGPEYAASTTNPIYVQVMVNGALKGDLGTNGQLYTLSAATSEAEVLNALSIQTATTQTSITGRNGLTLTQATSDATITAIPGVDGKNIQVTAGQAASFTATAGNYAYVYNTGEWDGIPVTLDAEPTGWPTGYYTNKACTTEATGDFNAQVTYYQKVSYIYSAETMGASAPSDWTTEGLWYKDPNGVTAAGDWVEANNGKVFYKRYTVDNKIYGVKVIKVQ